MRMAEFDDSLLHILSHEHITETLEMVQRFLSRVTNYYQKPGHRKIERQRQILVRLTAQPPHQALRDPPEGAALRKNVPAG